MLTKVWPSAHNWFYVRLNTSTWIRNCTFIVFKLNTIYWHPRTTILPLFEVQECNAILINRKRFYIAVKLWFSELYLLFIASQGCITNRYHLYILLFKVYSIFSTWYIITYIALTYLKNIIFITLLRILIYTVILLLRIVLRIYLHTWNSTSKPMQCHQFL